MFSTLAAATSSWVTASCEVCSGALFAAGAGLQRHRWQLPSPRLRPKEWLAKARFGKDWLDGAESGFQYIHTYIHIFI